VTSGCGRRMIVPTTGSRRRSEARLSLGVVVINVKHNITVILLMWAVSVFAADEISKPVYPTEVAAVLRKELPAGWRCTADHNCIVICRDEQVTRLNLISLPLLKREDLLAEFGHKTDYLIVLVFRPRLSDKQVEELRSVRDHAVEKIRPEDDMKHSRTSQESRKYLVPDYFNSQFSIYLNRTDDGSSAIYPESAAKERDAILAVLSRMVERYGDHNKASEPSVAPAPQVQR